MIKLTDIIKYGMRLTRLNDKNTIVHKQFCIKNSHNFKCLIN